MEPRGKLITFEGGEGTGKSTQARLLQVRARSAGQTRRPDPRAGRFAGRRGNPQASRRRRTRALDAALRDAAVPRGARRSCGALIEPALAQGEWVISDRFSDSTFVYQGVARGLGIEKVRRLQEAALGSFAPDLTIMLDLDPARRLEARRRTRAGEREPLRALRRRISSEAARGVSSTSRARSRSAASSSTRARAAG